jgi:hypothetical protein
MHQIIQASDTGSHDCATHIDDRDAAKRGDERRTNMSTISNEDYARLSTGQRLTRANTLAAGLPYVLPWKRTHATNAAEAARKLDTARGRPSVVTKPVVSASEYEKMSLETRIARATAAGPSPEEIRRRRLGR